MLLFLSCVSFAAGCAAPSASQRGPRSRVLAVERPGPEWGEIGMLGHDRSGGTILTNDDRAVIFVFSVPSAGRTALEELQNRRRKQTAAGEACSGVSVSDDRAAFQCTYREKRLRGATVVLRKPDCPDLLIIVRANWPDTDETMPAILSRVIKSIRVE